MESVRAEHKRIAIGMLLASLYVLVGKLMGALKEMVVAWRYGVSEIVDGYLFVFNLVSWPVGVWFSVLMVVLLPLASRLRHVEAGALPRFRAEILGLTLMVGLGLSLLAWFGLPIVLRAEWVGLAPGVKKVALDSVLLLALLPLPGVLISLYSAWMLSREQHANTLFEGLPALGILLAVLLLPFEGVEPLLWGTMAGLAFHLATLFTVQARIGETELPRFGQTSLHWGGFWHGFGFMMAGQAIMSVTGIIDQFFAAGLGSGAISTLGYANRIMALILGLGATAVSRATLPVFSRIQSEVGTEATRYMMIRWSAMMFVSGLIVTVLCWLLAPLIVEILFQRGGFTIKDTHVVSEVFRFSLLQTPFYFALLVVSSLLASVKAYRSYLYWAIWFILMKMLTMILCLDHFGLNAIPLSNSAGFAASFVLSVFVIWKRDYFH